VHDFWAGNEFRSCQGAFRDTLADRGFAHHYDFLAAVERFRRFPNTGAVMSILNPYILDPGRLGLPEVELSDPVRAALGRNLDAMSRAHRLRRTDESSVDSHFFDAAFDEVLDGLQERYSAYRAVTAALD
jgi:hypothetical protein